MGVGGPVLVQHWFRGSCTAQCSWTAVLGRRGAAGVSTGPGGTVGGHTQGWEVMSTENEAVIWGTDGACIGHDGAGPGVRLD